MAYALVVVAEIDRDDVTTAVDTALFGLGVGVGNGITFANDGRMFIEVENGPTQTIASVVTQCTVDGQAVADPTYTIPLNQDHIFGPFPPSIYNTAAGRVEVSFSDVTDGTVSVWRLS
jgi:hypothetical protein